MDAALHPQENEAALNGFLDRLPETGRLPARTLAHAWVGGGGTMRVGRIATRLTAGEPPFTAATLHAPRRDGDPARLELCRIILEQHGVDHDRWIHWSDELAELQRLGLDPAERFPTLDLDARLGAAELARLATSLRDLAHLAGARA